MTKPTDPTTQRTGLEPELGGALRADVDLTLQWDSGYGAHTAKIGQMYVTLNEERNTATFTTPAGVITRTVPYPAGTQLEVVQRWSAGIAQRIAAERTGLEPQLGGALDVTGYKPFRYLTYEAVADWKEERESLERELEELKADILARYDEFVDAKSALFTEIAQRAWDALAGVAGAGGGALMLEGGRRRLVFEDKAAFTGYIVKRYLERMPGRADIQNIRVTYQYRVMVSQADLAEDEYLAEFWRAETAKERARTAYFDEQSQAKRRLAREEEDAQKRVIQEHEWTQRRLIRAGAEAQELANRERNLRLEAGKEIIQEEIRQQIAGTVDPFVEVMLANRARLHEALDRTMQSIERNGYLHGRTVEGIRNMVEAFNYYREFDPALAVDVSALEELLERRIPHPERKRTTTYDVERVKGQVRALMLATQDAGRQYEARLGGTRAGALMD
ncbi:MAG: hypothetical protein JXB47_03080 [Anaerolineae bacterium]|nr:hypothetical protein [Anaerolineae bacterium]